MTKAQIETIRKLAESHDFKGVPIPQLCDLAILGAIVKEMWRTEYFQPSADAMWEAKKAFKEAEYEYLDTHRNAELSDFRLRYPGVL